MRFAETEINNPPLNVTLTLSGLAQQARIYLPNDSPQFIASYQQSQMIQLSVPDRMMIVDLIVPEPAGAALLIFGALLLRRR